MKKLLRFKKASLIDHWNARSKLYAGKYLNPTGIDKLFWKNIYRFHNITQSTLLKCEGKTLLLDIGCGPGINAVNWLIQHNKLHITGIDIAEHMITYAQQKATDFNLLQRCTFICGDFMAYDFENHKYDIVVASGVTDYIEDISSFVSRIANMTQCTFIISWPRKSIRSYFRKLWYPFPVFSYSRKHIMAIHHAAGVKDFEFAVETYGAFITIGRK
ncbi:MAG: methyltransferase domain-containing protein [Chitinophagaceae bacterium]|nr:methyltransferase domain-containing protein [Chitinophagaceae bacterium]